jgi:hypothetical protein
MTGTPGYEARHDHRPAPRARSSPRWRSAVLPLTACGADAPAAPAPGEASTGIPLNVGSEDPAATTTASVSP